MNPLILVPIIYVFYGSNVPDYLWLNIELASRYNDVIIISHMKHYQHTSDEYRSQNRRVIFENLDDYTTSANEFAPAYIHLMKADYSEHRVKHERACFQRWFVLKDYMEKNNISRSFFGDGDSSVFVNVTQINALHSHCDAVINVETQDSKFKWTGAGEASLWSLHAIQDFCRFTTDMYKSHIEVIKLKGGRGKTNFVDMSMLYVWWVSHHDAPGWEAGRPWLIEDRNPNAGMLATTRKFCDEEFQVVKKQNLPVSENGVKLRLCNGVSVVNRTVFDHFVAWEWVDGFNLNLNGTGIPYGIGVSQRVGGVPESLDPKDLEILSSQRLYFNNIHYQGGDKSHVPYDVCRVLKLTGDKHIVSTHISKMCTAELNKRPNLECVKHGEAPYHTCF